MTKRVIKSAQTIVLTCLNCKKKFDWHRYDRTRKYCTQECRRTFEMATVQSRGKRIDKRLNRAYTCQECGNVFQRRPRPGIKYCSRQCAVAQRNADRRYPPKACVYCQKDFIPRHATQVYCCRECQLSDETTPNAINRKIGMQRRTDIEAIMEKCLQDLGVTYEWERRFGRYRVDFYLPDYNLAIECDGIYWHTGEKQIRDKRRDEQLTMKHGLQVRRFTDKEIFGDIKDMVTRTLAC